MKFKEKTNFINKLLNKYYSHILLPATFLAGNLHVLKIVKDSPNFRT